MIHFFKPEFKKCYCINNCELFCDEKDYSYWENRKTTSDEISVVNFLLNQKLHQNKRILHIGVGNSYIANKLNGYDLIDGITISSSEISYANSIGIENYNVNFQNKFSKDTLFSSRLKNYDIIIDINLKSYSCCQSAFDNLFKVYSAMLKKDGLIISSIKGMNWSKQIKPVYSFSFRRPIYRKLKEFDGPSSNILTIKECEKLCKINNLQIYTTNPELIILKNET